MDGPIFKFYKGWFVCENAIISEGSYLPNNGDSQRIYAFERHLDGQNSW